MPFEPKRALWGLISYYPGYRIRNAGLLSGESYKCEYCKKKSFFWAVSIWSPERLILRGKVGAILLVSFLFVLMITVPLRLIFESIYLLCFTILCIDILLSEALLAVVGIIKKSKDM